MSWTIKNTIVVPYDFSDHSRIAVDKALEIAGDPRKVHVLHVMPDFVPLAPEGFPLDVVDDSTRVEYALKAVAKELTGPAYQNVFKEVLLGDAGSVCADRAEELNADLIIMPSHGRTGLTRLLMGSVAERIVRLSKCPVLVLKLTKAAESTEPSTDQPPLSIGTAD